VADEQRKTREELAGLLTAISIVSKRLAGNLLKLQTPAPTEKAS
jgi:hypothetical protein